MLGIKGLKIRTVANKDEISLIFFLVADVDDLIGNIRNTFSPVKFDIQFFGQPARQGGYGLTRIDDHLVMAVEAAQETVGHDRSRGFGYGAGTHELNGPAFLPEDLM